MLNSSAQIHKWGDVSKLSVEKNYLLDADGNQVMLHGIMDTPSPYFSGYRFSDGNWINVYDQGDNYINKCVTYFDQLFTAVTDTAQGSWCNVFRLHLDPCWTDNPGVIASGFVTKNGKTYDPNGNEVGGESNIQHFDRNRLTKYLDKLYLEIAKKAKGHGMYVIMRPPGVCPNTIKVGDYYQQYLLTVWDIVSKNQFVKDNSDWLSIELANEPIAIKDADGGESNSRMRDFFQPIVDKIRANGFNGIIWVPGGSWQQDYRPYAKKPITDPMYEDNPQIGYAVHFYPGWYNTSDKATDASKSISSFADMVPVVKTSPIMITEVDWSPENPNTEGKYNEWGEWVHGNYGTWGTGSTSKFGVTFKAVVDYFGNIGWTLTHTHDYLDIDYYLGLSVTEPHKPLAKPEGKGVVRPAFYTKLSNNAYEACSGACFQWYREYAKTEHVAKEWELPAASDILPTNEQIGDADKLDGMTLFLTDPDCESILYVNSNNASPQNVSVGDYLAIKGNPYCWVKFNKVANPGCATAGNHYTIQLANEMGVNYTLWGSNGYLNTPPGTWCLFALGLGNKYGQDKDFYGLWKVDYEEGKGFAIQNVGAKEAGENSWLNAAAGTPQGSKCYVRLFGALGKKPTAIEQIESAIDDCVIYDINGNIVAIPEKGKVYIRNGKMFMIK